jgi:undecaprenyl diphosphate synthase
MKIPTHVSFIMDGNRRWASTRKLQILFGHDKGAHQIEPLVEYATRQGISFLTFWAFSTENWNRDAKEVAMLMQVFRNIFKDPMVQRMKKDGVKMQVIGDMTKFPQDIQDSVQALVEDTKSNSKICVNLALNYGGREEILQAVNKLVIARTYGTKQSGINEEFIRDRHVAPRDDIKMIDEEMFSKYLCTKDLPDPDLLIRTGGEKRLSGFLPWQSVYSELYFTDTLWPDFDSGEFQKALDEYALRERRFGK